jgi:general secretion pathway protein C
MAGNWKAQLKEIGRKLGAATSGLRSKLAPAVSKAKSAAGAGAQKYKLRERFVRLLPADLAQSFPRTMDPLALLEWTTRALQKQGAAVFGKLLTILLCAFFLADVLALLVDKYVPEPPVVRGVRTANSERRNRAVEDYNVIFARNLFNSQGLIPGEEEPKGMEDMGGVPVKTSLPFNLIGTLILRDELRSIATIEDKAANMVYPVRAQDEIPNKAKIISVEADRVVFLNTSNGRREFIELPKDLQTSNPRVNVGRPSNTGSGIEKVAPTQYSVSRNEVDKALGDLNQVLTQARCVPNFENGLPSGFKCFQIVPGSIYDKLGMKNGDVLCGIDGQPINDPGKAFELLGQLKTASHLDLCVKRNGQQMTMSYDFH